MTATCPKCGSAVAAGERFCGECGTDIQAFRAQQSQPAVAPPAYTPPALQNVGPGPSYPAYVAPTAPAAQPQTSNVTRMLGIGLVALSVLACLGVVLLGYVASTQDVGAEADSTVLGGWVCAIGLLLALGIPGIVLLFVARRR